MDGLENRSAAATGRPAESPVDPVAVAAAADLIAGLTSAGQRYVPSRFSYSDEGSRLYEQLCQQPEYYLTRTERKLLEANAPAIAAALGSVNLYELGAGNSEKTAILLRELQARDHRIRYRPVDVNAFILGKGQAELARAIPGLSVEPIVATYDQALEAMARDGGARRRAIALLGSSFGNFRPGPREDFLAKVRGALRPGETFLLSTDLDKPAEVLTAAYNDRAGILASMELGVLRTLNEAFGANFDPRDFRHLAFHNAAEMRIESHLLCLRDHAVRLPKLGLELQFKEGESLCNDVMNKPTLESLADVLAAAGFSIVHQWIEEPKWYAILLLKRE